MSQVALELNRSYAHLRSTVQSLSLDKLTIAQELDRERELNKQMSDHLDSIQETLREITDSYVQVATTNHKRNHAHTGVDFEACPIVSCKLAMQAKTGITEDDAAELEEAA